MFIPNWIRTCFHHGGMTVISHTSFDQRIRGFFYKNISQDLQPVTSNTNSIKFCRINCMICYFIMQTAFLFKINSSYILLLGSTNYSNAYPRCFVSFIRNLKYCPKKESFRAKPWKISSKINEFSLDKCEIVYCK